jgi:hypothetical protein
VGHHSVGVYASLERRSNDKKSLKIKTLEQALELASAANPRWPLGRFFIDAFAIGGVSRLARPVIKKDALDRSRVANITA